MLDILSAIHDFFQITSMLSQHGLGGFLARVAAVAGILWAYFWVRSKGPGFLRAQGSKAEEAARTMDFIPRMAAFFLVLAGILFLAGKMPTLPLAGDPGPTAIPQGARVRTTPTLSPISDQATWTRGSYRLAPVARFRAQAVVLGKERYWFDSPSDLSPADLALGWGPMSDPGILSYIKLSQGSRTMYYSYRPPEPLSDSEINGNSRNIHIIPADEAVNAALGSIHEGDEVFIDGITVDAEGPNDWNWKTARALGGSGEGSCLLLWVERLSVESPAP